MNVVACNSMGRKTQGGTMASAWNSRLRGLPAGLLVLSIISLPICTWAGGLSCSVGEVVINNLKIGQTYSLQALANLPLVVTNTSDQPVHILVDALVPDSSELRRQACPIPDAAWATAAPDSFDLGSRETKAVEMLLRIPDDESLFGKTFQVTFWSHTLAQAGDMLAYGLNTRVIFSIDKVRETSGMVPSGELSLSLTPATMTLDGIVPGREYRLEELLHQPLVVRNTSGQSLSIELRTLNSQQSAIDMMPGYADLLEAAKVNLSPSRLTLKPGEQTTVTGTVLFSKQARSAGKKYMCVVSAEVMDLPVKTQIYSRIYAHIE
jgi:hypothetical protein